jgi:putative sigma-54 modulation protein
MKVKIHSIHFDADQKLINFVQEKVDKLDHYFDQIIDGEVFLKIDNADNNENKIAEIKLSIPGNNLFAKKQCKTFEEATDSVVDALRRQIRKKKGKLNPA